MMVLDHDTWERNITPGAKIIMTMFVEGGGFGVDECPRCGGTTDVRPTLDLKEWYA
jgi:hypothetical protein